MQQIRLFMQLHEALARNYFNLIEQIFENEDYALSIVQLDEQINLYEISLYCFAKHKDKIIKQLEHAAEKLHITLNIKSLLDQMQQSSIISLHEYLQNFALSSERSSKAEDAINIMTIHAAKGLEFKTVFSPAWEENILPFAKKGQIIENYTDIEEERRLAYVVMTRAKENLYLSFSLYRIRYGATYYNNPSRFLDDIPPACAQVAK